MVPIDKTRNTLFSWTELVPLRPCLVLAPRRPTGDSRDWMEDSSSKTWEHFTWHKPRQVQPALRLNTSRFPGKVILFRRLMMALERKRSPGPLNPSQVRVVTCVGTHAYPWTGPLLFLFVLQCSGHLWDPITKSSSTPLSTDRAIKRLIQALASYGVRLQDLSPQQLSSLTGLVQLLQNLGK